ncbi:MAG: hypothetical protein ACK4ZD_04515 [Caldimonas sp.]|uniref:hypothetical protein n=1 Tax=Caldimonas sp. TaxID=2838790 RepID=UPI003918DB29
MPMFPNLPPSSRWSAALAWATLLAGCAAPDIRGVSTFRVPPGNVPPVGQCAIWYPGLPPAHQPPPMSCNKAHADAETWGGVVIWAETAAARRSGEVAYVRYGNHRLHGVPPGMLPPPGRCRLWLPGRPDGQQPAPGDCRRIEAEQRTSGGRVIYMPASDLR